MCTRELTAYRNPTGGRPIFGWEGVKEGLTELKLPCGKCPECVKDYYTSWATRGSRELLNWESSVFVTLTFNEENLPRATGYCSRCTNPHPIANSLCKSTIQDFIKRVKKNLGSTKDNPIRQSYCGEYGDKNGRPHYHVILYNCDFPDRVPHYISESGHQVYKSEKLQSMWEFGNAEFGYATSASIAYLYKYILKKKTRKEKEKGPLVIESNGITYEVAHEFIESSRNPGIGACMRGTDSIKKGFLTVNGVKKKLPKYYMEWLREHMPDTYDYLSNLKFDFMLQKPVESPLRKKQKEEAQKRLTDTKRKL